MMDFDEIKGDAAYLFKRGYRSSDRARLIEEYSIFGISDDYADAVCGEIARLEGSE